MYNGFDSRSFQTGICDIQKFGEHFVVSVGKRQMDKETNKPWLPKTNLPGGSNHKGHKETTRMNRTWHQKCMIFKY